MKNKKIKPCKECGGNEMDYEIIFIYGNLRASFGIGKLLPGEKGAQDEINDVRLRGYEDIEKQFKEIAKPVEKFDLKKLEIIEIYKGEEKDVEIGLIEALQQREDVRDYMKEEPPKPSVKEMEEEKEEEKDEEFRNTGREEGMTFEEIKNKTKLRIASLEKAVKEYREKIEQLILAMRSAKLEMRSLKALMKTAEGIQKSKEIKVKDELDFFEKEPEVKGKAKKKKSKGKQK